MCMIDHHLSEIIAVIASQSGTPVTDSKGSRTFATHKSIALDHCPQINEQLCF